MRYSGCLCRYCDSKNLPQFIGSRMQAADWSTFTVLPAHLDLKIKDTIFPDCSRSPPSLSSLCSRSCWKSFN